MDTITHTVLGACIGDAILGKKLGKKGMLLGALAANLPDVDVFYSSFQKVPDNLLSHRGFTHSILFCSLMVPLLALLFEKFYKKKEIGFRSWFWLFFIGLFSHIGIDSLTNYGTGWFEPFSHQRISFDTIFVADPFFTIALLIAAIVLLVLKNNSSLRKPVIKTAFFISGAYLLFTFINKFSMNAVFEKSLKENQVSFSDYFISPTPLNNFLWYGIAKCDSGYFLGSRSLFDQSPFMNIYFIPQQDSMLDKYRDDEAVKKLIRFSQNYYTLSKSDSGVVDFHDIRFGQIGFNKDAPFVFKFHLTKNENSKTIINEGEFDASTGDAFDGLIKRIKGE